MGKTNFEQRPKYANLCLLAELAHGRCKFFCHQKKRKVKLDKVREGLRPITLRFRANALKLILGSIGTPLDHLSVKYLQLFTIRAKELLSLCQKKNDESSAMFRAFQKSRDGNYLS